ncbi:bifunctional riboflavin kinase/FAD synthetase [Caloramator australicus]|uniref:Riboflavin biosynthesis protein n=1 Tax=Caloramator australicus RC3 TaxID=857293 RepID=I7KUE6_9CLOT|nr:bifunctional riboflavin kinase/FAD synthetase [Caloramator australicus]CCJ33538.1 Riboflavin kinase / FMN adenylyltransferase [Caloramator australicus RC3]
MIIFEGKYNEIFINRKTVIALGTFDGIHFGHRKIIEGAVKEAKTNNLNSAVLTFKKPVFSYFNKNATNYLINPIDIKTEIISSLGVDYLIYVDLEDGFINLPPEQFLEYLKHNLNAEIIVCGYNYTFGKNAQGDIEYLKENAEKYNINVIVFEEILMENLRVSSSLIRECLLSGDVELANKLLGYNYYLKGRVIRGKSLASRLGFATANIIVDRNLCLKNGVYITLTHYKGNSYPSITNIGYNPTFEQKQRVCETHILKFEKNIYDKIIKIEFMKYLREERKFNSIFDLQSRIKKDIKLAENYFKI